ncbi:cysteine hydrolase family protein [Cellulomonas alba]|uniref:Isochorismatase family cysteine hydrolase n=1 Tax=Cellulomonas alba TaxID=3053467 RepID=A0ABT7SFJ4_9CELL|nr:isochorismatase family cysteine hydrolase [Cellulomonas alba]MDM7854962.1 isochorismatase family cysteine hydrolase [Cellulomonas alba]
MTTTVDHTSLHVDRAALVVIDVQTDFVDGSATVPGTAEVLPRLAQLIRAFRAAGRPVAHVVRLYVPGSADVDTVRRAAVEGGAQIVAPGTPGAQIPAVLTGGAAVELDAGLLLAGGLQELGAREVVVGKQRWSAFHRTGLDAWLAAQDVDSVVVAGCNLPNCPRATLFDASERDYRTALVVDATSQTTPERLADLTLIGVNLVTTDELAARLLAP